MAVNPGVVTSQTHIYWYDCALRKPGGTMKLKKRLFFSLLALCVIFCGIPFPGKKAVQAQPENCYWQLISETPKSFTVSSAPEATSLVSGTTVTVNWEGLTTTHSWSYPGSTLKPGDTLDMEVSVSWDVSTGEARNSTGGLRTTFYFNAEKVSAGQDSISFNAERSGSVSNYESFTIPSGSKEGATLSIYGFGDAAVGSGRVDYKYSYKCATPTPSITLTITKTPTRTITPTKCPADTEEKKLAEILKLYTARIPNGIASTGKMNNIYDFFGYAGYAEFTCGGYQSKVLDFLNALKYSQNPCERELLDNWDYGPIQAWFGYHQAVAIYPKGTDWTQTGIVLDPWPKQTPKSYSANDWAIMFSATGYSPGFSMAEQITGPSFIGIGASDVYREGQAYPIVGGDYKNASNEDMKITFSADDFRIIQSLPKEKREAFNKMPKSEQKSWLQVVRQGGEKIQKTIANCPLTLYLLSPEGKRSGISGSEIFNELPDVSFMMLKLTDGTNYTEISYPDNAGYTLVLEATNQGQAHVFTGHTLLLGDPIPALQQYSFSPEAGKTYQISTDQLGRPMQWDGGSLQPQAVKEISGALLESLPGLAFPEEGSLPGAPSGETIADKPAIFVWQPPFWLGVLVLLFGLFLFTLIAVILISKIVKNKKHTTYQYGQLPIHRTQSATWVLLIVLLVIACLSSSCGIMGLVMNLRSESSVGNQVPEMALTSDVIKMTEMSLNQKLTQSSQSQGILMTATNTELAPPTPQPTQAIAQTPLPPTPPTIEPTAVSLTTGKQSLDEYSLVDDFSSNAFGWPEIDDGKKITKFEEGGYSFQLLNKGEFDVVYLPVSLKPSEIRFDVRGVEGEQNGTFGIFCHLQDQYNYYYVEFDMLTKTYVIAQSFDGEYIPLTTETASGQFWHEAESFYEPTDINKISIGCYLGSIYVMVNDVIVDDVSIDQPFSENGKTALFVFTYDFAGEDGYKVIFDNLEAYEPRQ